MWPILLFYFILGNVGALTQQPKLCVNCKFFIPYETGNDNLGKCSITPYIQPTLTAKYNLVTGEPNPVIKTKFYYCSTARTFENMCGPDGKKYKKKYVRRQ
jgi:hypothetical protein